jgi:hypothetical protein
LDGAVLQGWRDHQEFWRVTIDDREDIYLNNEELSESIYNVVGLPSIEQTTMYLHTNTGFPTKRTWLPPIKKGTFIGWLMVSAENVSKYFPQNKETVQGYMNHQGPINQTKETNP